MAAMPLRITCAILLASSTLGAIAAPPDPLVLVQARPSLSDSLPLHVRDELALIVRQIDAGDLASVRQHWRQLVADERRAGRGANIEHYLDWLLQQAYHDEIEAADRLVDENRFYDTLRRRLRQHEQEMEQMLTVLPADQMRVLRTVAHIPIYRPDDPPAPEPIYAPRQMDRERLRRYLAQLRRDIDRLADQAQLPEIDLAAARAQRDRLAQRTRELADRLRQDVRLPVSPHN